MGVCPGMYEFAKTIGQGDPLPMTASMQAHSAPETQAFAASQALFTHLVEILGSGAALAKTHSQVEELVQTHGMQLLCQLFQDQMDLRARGEGPRPVTGADGIVRTDRRRMRRFLETRFGRVSISRLSYGRPDTPSLRPLDAELNLPVEIYSLGVRRLAAENAALVSFDETREAIARTSGAHVPKRQVEEIVERAAEHVDAFYAQRAASAADEQAPSSALVVLSTDGKGVVMRAEGLRAATRAAAEASAHKLEGRLSAGEKRNRKRMAQVAATYTVAPFVRTPEEVVRELRAEPRAVVQRPTPEGKRVWASLEKGPEQVISAMMDEALSRDPARAKTWVAVVDGNRSQLRLIETRALEAGVAVCIVLDLMHVIEYVWTAAWVFHEKGTREAEQWVRERVLEILRGKSSAVAGGIRRSATLRGLSTRRRAAADRCADYLITYGKYLRYDRYLAAGYPIASGVIEGACRHLVQDRMDITGARWGLADAEAVLKLRSLRASGDFDAYWRFHEQQLFESNHAAGYAGNTVPVAAPPPTRRNSPALKRVK
jgi:hypothetical protein